MLDAVRKTGQGFRSERLRTVIKKSQNKQIFAITDASGGGKLVQVAAARVTGF